MAMSRRTGLLAGTLVLALAVGGVAVAWWRAPRCSPTVENPEWSVARHWDEALLDAIRRDLPAPTVHARNLFHASAAMWDAWAAYEPSATGVFYTEKHEARDVEAAREEAISYAAYRVLEVRYLESVGASDTIPEFDRLMEALCHPIEVTTTEGESPAAIGNRIARVILDAGKADGSNEVDGYTSPDYEPVNPPLVVKASGTTMTDPNRWQPLEIENMVSQNGILLDSGVQQFIDPHWGHVTGFALPEAGSDGVPIDPGGPPRLGDPATDQIFKDQAVEVIRYSSRLDPTQNITVDISPGGFGANPLGTNDGSGHPLNPVTGEPYQPNLVNQADYQRILAEFWADGPKSETPPGHWNTVANTVSDALAPDLRIASTGPVVDRLEWDVKLYLALNGATHDSAVAAWGIKNRYDSVRPISMIRYMGGLGQSSDPNQPAYHPEGLPLVPDLIEVVTEETTMPRGRHETLAGHEGEIAVRSWLGNPADPEAEIGGVGWIRAVDWIPYQRTTFVTPAFAGFISGHSTFSRAAAEILTSYTGSEYFPGGLGEWSFEPGSLDFEAGPEQGLTLQWATFADAADQAGLSRLFGGIHISADDLAGRKVGYLCGSAAWERAQLLFGAPDE